MNKKELIKRIEESKNLFGNKTKYIAKDTAIELASELDEPKECKYLKWNGVQNYWYFGNGKNPKDIRLYHTLENLQKGGFGNVFVNPLFTIEEVEE